MKIDIEANQQRIAMLALRESKQSQNKQTELSDHSEDDTVDDVGSITGKKKGIQLRNYVSIQQSAANYRNDPRNENTIKKYELYC